MRIKLTKKEGPEYHGRKTETKFLWLPIIINNELRWLEKATILYSYDSVSQGLAEDGDDWDWVPIEFIDLDEAY